MNSIHFSTYFFIEKFLAQLHEVVVSLPIDQERDKHGPIIDDLVLSLEKEEIEEDENDLHNKLVKRIIKKVCAGIVKNTLPDFSKLLPDSNKILSESPLFNDSEGAYANLKNLVIEQKMDRKDLYHKFIEGMVFGSLYQEGVEIWIRKEMKQKEGISNPEQFELGKKLFCHLKGNHLEQALSILAYLVDYDDPKQIVVDYFNEVCQKLDPKDTGILIGMAKKILTKCFIKEEKVEAFFYSLEILSDVSGKRDLFEFAAKHAIKPMPRPIADSKKNQTYAKHIEDYNKKKNLASLKQAIELLKGMHFANIEMWKEVMELAIKSKENINLQNKIWRNFKETWRKAVKTAPENVINVWMIFFKYFTASEDLIIHLNAHLKELIRIFSWPQLWKIKPDFYEALLDYGIDRLEKNPKLIEDEKSLSCFCHLFTMAIHSLPSEKNLEDYREIFKKMLMIAETKNTETQQLVADLILKICRHQPSELSDGFWIDHLMQLSYPEVRQNALMLFIWGMKNGINFDSIYVKKAYHNLLERLDFGQLNQLRLEGLNCLSKEKIDCQIWKEWIIAYLNTALEHERENEIKLIFMTALDLIKELNKKESSGRKKTKEYLDINEKKHILISAVEVCIKLIEKFNIPLFDSLFTKICNFVFEQPDSKNLLTSVVNQLVKDRKLEDSKAQHLISQAADLFCQNLGEEENTSPKLVHDLVCQLSKFKTQPEIKERLYDVISQDFDFMVYQYLFENFRSAPFIVNKVIYHKFRNDDLEFDEIIHALNFLFKMCPHMEDKLENRVIGNAFRLFLSLINFNKKEFNNFAAGFFHLICKFPSAKIIYKMLNKFKTFIKDIGSSNPDFEITHELVFFYGAFLREFLEVSEMPKKIGISCVDYLLNLMNRIEEASEETSEEASKGMFEKVNDVLRVGYYKKLYEPYPTRFWMHRSFLLSFVDQDQISVFIPENSSKDDNVFNSSHPLYSSRLNGIKKIIENLTSKKKPLLLFRTIFIISSEMQEGFEFEVSDLKEICSLILDSYVSQQCETKRVLFLAKTTLPGLIFDLLKEPYAIEIVPLIISALIKIYEAHSDPVFLKIAGEYLKKAFKEKYYAMEDILEKEEYRTIYAEIIWNLLKYSEKISVPLAELVGGEENIERLFGDRAQEALRYCETVKKSAES